MKRKTAKPPKTRDYTRDMIRDLECAAENIGYHLEGRPGSPLETAHYQVLCVLSWLRDQQPPTG